MTPQEAALELLRRRRGRASLAGYANAIEIPGKPATDDPDEWLFRPVESGLAAHHLLLLQTIERAASRRYGRLMVFMPPGSAKSTMASVVAPTYIMGKNPGTKVILASYGSDLARKHGRKARQIVRSSGFSSLFGATISKDSSAANEWALTNGSEYMAAGLMAGLTGNRANCLSGSTMVATDDGESRIDSLVESGDPGYVLSYDINSQRLVHRRIKAVARSEAACLYRVRTTNGGVVDCTGDHRLYTQRGFVEARLLSSDDRLLRLVRAEPEEECLPDEEGGQEGAGRSLLRPRMPAAGGECSGREAGCRVQGVRNQASAVCAGGAERVAVLRGCVQGVCREGEKGLDDAEEAGAAMRDVQHQLQAEDHECAGPVLRQGMQGPRTLCADDAGEESGLAQWCESGASGRAQRKELQGCEAKHHQAGWRGVRRVRGNEGAACSPHRHELHEQRMAESGDAVPRMSHAASWCGSFDTTGDLVAVVERLCGPAMVYDIQVDGTECFFANGLLVHNCAIIDDPIKGREQADSPTIRNKTWEAYTDDLQTRLIPGGSMVLVQTRWHEDDLSGRLLPKNYAGESGMVECRDGRMWEVINLPAECERADDPLGRKVGEMLWPEWFDSSHWAPFRKQSRTWASLFQQRPRPDEGGIFKDGWCVRRWAAIPREADLCVHSWDTAQKPDQLNDPSVGTMWRMGGKASGYYLADLYRERVDYPTLRRKVMAYAERDRPAAVLIEDKSSGQSLIQELRTTTTLPVIAIEPHGSKLFRANEVSSMVESGLLILPESAPWLVDFEGEFFGFPLTTHDDQVDSVTQFLKWVRGWSRSVESYGAGMTRTLASQMTDSDLEEAAGGWGSVGRGTDMDGFN